MFDIVTIRNDFQRNGCSLLPGFLNGQELLEIRTRTEDFFDTTTQKVDTSTTGKFSGTFKNLNVYDPWFADQLLHGKQAQLISDLLDDELEPATAVFFDRIPGETNGIAPHYDALGHRRMGATIWIALDKSDKNNGCLYYAQRTHLHEYADKLDIEGFTASSPGAIAVELEPGDAAIHSSRTVHWSYPNTSNRSRRAISYFYWAASSKPDPKLRQQRKVY